MPSMPPAIPSKTPEPEDIFSGTGPKSGSAYPTSPATASIAESPARGFGRKLVRLLFLALGAAVIVAVGYFGYHYFFAAPTSAPVGTVNVNLPIAATNQPVANIPAPPENSNTNTGANTNTNANAPIVIPPPNVNNNAPSVLAPQDDPNSTVDSDNDGLTDYQEIHICHTNPLKPDTDNDGLSDRDEVMVWHTDPLNPDTDGDGYTDGTKVKNGYNPLGPGKLLTPPIAPQ
jgi:hypothetical protein